MKSSARKELMNRLGEFDGLTLAQVAGILGCRPKTIETYIYQFSLANISNGMIEVDPNALVSEPKPPASCNIPNWQDDLRGVSNLRRTIPWGDEFSPVIMKRMLRDIWVLSIMDDREILATIASFGFIGGERLG